MSTLAALLRKNAAEWPDRVAMRRKSRGIWETLTWAQCQDRVEALALGLRELGSGRGKVVAILCANSPDLVIASIAAQATGAATLVISADAQPASVAELLTQCAASIVVAQDQEQADKVLDAPETCELRVIYVKERGLNGNADQRLMAMRKLEELGTRTKDAIPGAYGFLLEQCRADDPQCIAPVAGPDGARGLAFTSNGEFMNSARTATATLRGLPNDEYVCLEALSHMTEQLFAIGGCLIAGMKINFVEDGQTAQDDFREIAPTVVHLSATRWQALASSAMQRLDRGRGFHGLLCRFALALGARARAGGWLSLAYRLLLGNAIRDRLGLSRVRLAISDGLAVTPEALRFYGLLGIAVHPASAQTGADSVLITYTRSRVNAERSAS